MLRALTTPLPGSRRDGNRDRWIPAARPGIDAADRGAAGRRIAAAPRAGGSARDPGARGGWRRGVLEPWPCFCCRCRGRPRAGEPRCGRAREPGWLPGRNEGRRIAAHGPADGWRWPSRRSGGRRARRLADAAARQAQHASRHPLRADRRVCVQPVFRDQAAALPVVLRREALRSDRHRLRWSRRCDGIRLRLARACAGHGCAQPCGTQLRQRRPFPLRCSQPCADRHRSAPHPEQPRVVLAR